MSLGSFEDFTYLPFSWYSRFPYSVKTIVLKLHLIRIYRTSMNLAVAYFNVAVINIHVNRLYFICYPTGVVAMHIESLEPVYREYKNLAPIQKVSIS